MTIFILGTSLYSVYAQATLIALLLGDKVATENFHLSVDIGMNISSLPNLEPSGSTIGLYFGLGTFIKLNENGRLPRNSLLHPSFIPLANLTFFKFIPLFFLLRCQPFHDGDRAAIEHHRRTVKVCPSGVGMAVYPGPMAIVTVIFPSIKTRNISHMVV